MAHATMSRDVLIDKLSGVFRQYGYEGASLARLSEATGLVKASLYYQFPRGKEDMAAAVLEALGEEIAREVLAPLADTHATPNARVARMAAGLARVYDGGRLPCVIDVFTIGEAEQLYRDEIRQVAVQLTTALRSLLASVGVPTREATRRAEDALISIQGSLVVARATGNLAPFKRVVEELPLRLLAGRIDQS